MKLFLAVLALVSCAFAEEWIPKDNKQVKDIHLECAKLHCLSPEQTAKVRNMELENEEPVRKYLVCTSERIGFFSVEHGYYADRVAKQFKMDMEEEKAKEFVDICIPEYYNRADKEVEKDVYKFHSCFMNTPVGKKLEYDAKRRHGVIV